MSGDSLAAAFGAAMFIWLVFMDATDRRFLEGRSRLTGRLKEPTDDH